MFRRANQPILISVSLVASLSLLVVAGVSHGLPAVVTAPPQVAAQCPYTPGPIPLLLPNPVDCGSFYMCSWYGTALLQHCPPVLHFNAKLQVCDSPEHANCVQRTTAAHLQHHYFCPSLQCDHSYSCV
ncbi:peritrophic matrix protein 3 precursor [Penaeus vannamei]|uniref:Peritrophic matrix protein 3 n=1 Tax=Penaeus vannamei TaxID=6689 RepID=A0A3R7PF41_PENVA|nr:peritrophic matrix protein 3 precursor [Penaeus vannamei]